MKIPAYSFIRDNGSARPLEGPIFLDYIMVPAKDTSLLTHFCHILYTECLKNYLFSQTFFETGLNFSQASKKSAKCWEYT